MVCAMEYVANIGILFQRTHTKHWTRTSDSPELRVKTRAIYACGNSVSTFIVVHATHRIPFHEMPIQKGVVIKHTWVKGEQGEQFKRTGSRPVGLNLLGVEGHEIGN